MARHARAALLVASASLAAVGSWGSKASAWEEWLSRFGHDDWRYPAWISAQMRACSCEVFLSGAVCHELGQPVDWQSQEFSWCTARHFLLNHMPEFDLYFLPGSVSVEGESMLDDNIAFALMAWNASGLDPRPPLKVAFPYLLPYATYHEARANWRPLFFAKFFGLAAGRATSREVLSALIGGGVQVMNWTARQWPDFPGRAPANAYELGPFASGSTPPSVAPFDVVAFGYASCTGWAKFLASALKAVGVPAREVGSPCWNTGEFSGLAVDNANVSACWAGGLPGGPSGGKYLNNHNWVEYWDNQEQAWRFLDIATSSDSEQTWFCGTFDAGAGCECSSNAGQASRDHEVLAPTWSFPGEDSELHGGAVLNVSGGLTLTSGEAVSPMPWSPRLRSPLGRDLKDIGLRMVNRTDAYRCKRKRSEVAGHMLQGFV